MICENGYSLTLKDGSIRTFNTDLELDAFLDEQIRLHPGSVNTSEFLTEAVDFQKEPIKILDEIASAVSSVSRKVEYMPNSDDPEDIVSYNIIDGSIGVNRFLQKFKVPSEDELFVQPFNKEAWKIRRKEALKQDCISAGMSLTEAEREAERLVAVEEGTWERYSKTGEEVHKIYEMVFKEEAYERPSDSYLSEAIFNNVKQQAVALKQSLKEKYGPTAKFYTEFGIISKTLSNEIMDQLKLAGYDSITGKIDLLVLDQYGKAHVYDFKVSRKDVGDWKGNFSKKHWDYAKKKAAAQQLAFYSKILDQYGIDVISAHIIPIKVDYTFEDSTHEIGIKNLVDIERQQEILIPDVLSGKWAERAKEVFPSEFTLTGDQITEWARQFNQLFPSQSVMKYRENHNRDVDWYFNNKDYTQEILPSDSRYADGYRFTFWKKGTNRKVAKAKTEEELRGIIEEYIEALSSKRSDTCVDVANRIKSVQQGNLSLDAFADFVPATQTEWVKTQFKRYFDEHWTFNEDETLNANGIFIFEKGGVCEIVSISENPLFNVINLGMGTSILGATTRDMNVNKVKTFEASYGNIGLMEVMLYVAQNQDKFRTRKIQQVRVINPSQNQEVSALNSELLDNYAQLKQKNPTVGLIDIDSNVFVEDVKALIEGAKSRMMSIDPDVLGQIKISDSEEISDYLNNCMSALKRAYSNLNNWADDSKISMGNPIWQAYMFLRQAYNSLKGVSSHNEKDKGEYWQKGSGPNGTMISSLQYSPSTNLRELGKIVDEFSAEVSKRCYERGWKAQQAFKKLYASRGNGTDVFRSWFRTDASGKIDERLLLLDPNSPDFKGSDADKEALTIFLEEINKVRFPNDNEADIEARKASLQYYELPLTEAKAIGQLKNGVNIVTVAKNKWQQFTTLTKDVFAEDEEDVLEHNSLGQQLYNKFDLTSGARRQKIENHGGAGYFDLNCERVFNQVLLAYTKSEVSKDFLPLVEGLRLGIAYNSSYGGAKTNDLLKTFDKAVKSKFYGQSIIPKEYQGIYKYFSFIRNVFTRMALSLNFTSFFRETLQGIYTGLSRAGVKMLPGIDEKNYIKALEYVIKESPKNFEGVSKLQQLNILYKMANQSMSQIANGRKLNWMNINNWSSDTLFLTATAPDFLHRVSILVAKMMGDGCWDAHTLNAEGKLTYDFKKDKRFEHYITNDTSHKDYLKEKSLYLKMIDEFNKQGYNLQEGDALPQAYTQTEASSIKNFGDLLYGHYDEESKSLFCDTFVGTFFMQYKTFLTSKLEMWTMPQGVHNTELLTQQFDPETHEELYQIIEWDEDKRPHRNIVKKSDLTEEQAKTATLYYDYEGIPLNGLLQESWRFLKDVATMNQEDLNEMWNDPTHRGLLMLALHDQFVMMLMTLLVTFLTGTLADVDEPLNEAKVRSAVRNRGPIDQLTYNVIWGSLQDSQFHNILGNFAQNPPMVTQISKFLKSSWQVIAGDHDLPYALTQNVGMIRNFQGMALNAEKLAE